MSTALLLPALVMGFLGSPHCMGMCGGIVTAFGISMKNLSLQKRGILIASYHTGRLLSYMGLGLIATIIGESVLAPMMTDNALPRIVLGLAIIFASLLMLGLPILNRLEKVGLGLWNALAPIRKKVLPMDNVPKALFAGLLWGLLPCGLVYGALVMAMSVVSTGEPMMGVLFMLAFGLGTLPMLVMTGATLSWLQQKVKAFNLRRFSGAIMLVSGLFVMLSPTAMHLMHGHHHGHGHEHAHHAHSEHTHGHAHHEMSHQDKQHSHEHHNTNHAHHHESHAHHH